MATSGFTYGKCKGDAKCVLMRLARTYSSRGPDRTWKGAPIVPNSSASALNATSGIPVVDVG